MNQIAYTREEWLAEGACRFGPDQMDWKFKCPGCGYVASAYDYKAAGAPESAVAFNCVGRYGGTGRRTAFGKNCTGPGPCDYTGGGFFPLNPVLIDGQYGYFEFAEEVPREAAQEAASGVSGPETGKGA